MSVTPRWSAKLKQAVYERQSPWRTPVLSTVDHFGVPDCRTVVLRQVVVHAGLELDFHSHKSAQKVEHLLTQSALSLCFWDQYEQQQLRLYGSTRIHSGDVESDLAWDALNKDSQRLYSVSGVSGQPIVQDRESVANGYEGFVLLRVKVARADFLDLASRPHYREKSTFCSDLGWQSWPVFP